MKPHRLHSLIGTICRTNKLDVGTGGALSLQNINILSLVHCTFSSNTAVHNGGALFIASFAEVHISTSLFENNKAYNGGAIYTNTGSFQGEIQNCTLRQNAAQGNAGALFTNGTSFIISHSNFAGNTCPTAGVIYFEGNLCTLHITQSKFVKTNNRANFFSQEKFYTGVIIVESAYKSVQMVSVNFTDNRLGAGLLLRASRAEVRHSVFEKNHGFIGGGIVGGRYPLVLVVINTTFIDNQGIGGAVMHLMNRNTIVQMCKFVAGDFSLINIQPLTEHGKISVRAYNTSFVLTKTTSSQTHKSMFTFSSLGFISASFHIWNIFYQLSKHKVLAVDRNLKNTTPPLYCVGKNVIFTGKVSQFASGLQDNSSFSFFSQTTNCLTLSDVFVLFSSFSTSLPGWMSLLLFC